MTELGKSLIIDGEVNIDYTTDGRRGGAFVGLPPEPLIPATEKRRGQG